MYKIRIAFSCMHNERSLSFCFSTDSVQIPINNSHYPVQVPWFNCTRWSNYLFLFSMRISKTCTTCLYNQYTAFCIHKKNLLQSIKSVLHEMLPKKKMYMPTLIAVTFVFGRVTFFFIHMLFSNWWWKFLQMIVFYCTVFKLVLILKHKIKRTIS